MASAIRYPNWIVYIFRAFSLAKIESHLIATSVCLSHLCVQTLPSLRNDVENNNFLEYYKLVTNWNNLLYTINMIIFCGYEF